MLQPLGIGQVVLKVRDLDRSLAFYRDLLGFRIAAELVGVMVFLSASRAGHRDLALLRVGDQAPSPIPSAVGVSQVAVQLRDAAALRRAHLMLTERDLLRGATDHGTRRSLYTVDPDGNAIELYVELRAPIGAALVAPARLRPLELD